MTREESIKDYIMPALKRTWNDDKCIEIISAIEQEPKTGHWTDGHCSICGCDVPAYIDDWKWQKDMDAKYCPNCGAKMEK